MPGAIGAPVFLSPAATWGGLYVLEGSRLGAAVLSRSVGPGLPSGFLGAAPRRGAWRRLLQELQDQLVEPAEIAAATTAAETVFDLFEKAGLLLLRPTE